MTPSTEASSTPWSTAELDPFDEEYIREKLSGVPYLGRVAIELAEGLEADSSRTVFALPANVYLEDATAAMLYAARNVSKVVRQEGIEGIDSAGMPFDMRDNETPEQFGQPTVPNGAKASIDPDAPIGYVRVEMQQNNEGRTVVGSLDPRTRTHSAITL